LSWLHPRLDRKGFTGLFLVALTIASIIYSPGLSAGFVFDDEYQFFSTGNIGPLISYLLGPRAVTQLTYLLNFRLAGANPVSYHWVGVVLHALNAVLLAGFAWRVLGVVEVPEARRRLLAWFSGGLLLTHAAMSEAVLYISARTDLLCTMFSLLALLVYLNSREREVTWARAAAIAILFGLALGSKEQAVALPLIFAVMELLFRERWGGFRHRGAWRVYVILGAVAVAGAFVIARYASAALTVGGRAGITPLEYFFTQWRSLGRYVLLYLAPLNLNLDYDWKPSNSPMEHNALLWLAGLIALGGLAWWKRDRGGIIVLGVIAALLFFTPTTSFLPIQDLISERRLYTPMIGVALVAAITLDRVGAGLSTKVWIAGLICVVLSFLTWQRANVWSHPVLLWQDTVQKSPGKFRGHYWLATVAFRAGQCQAAARIFERAASLSPSEQAKLQRPMALAYDCAGETASALAAIDRDLQAAPHDAVALALRGRYLAKLGRMDAALEALDRSLAADPNQPVALAVRGQVLMVQSQWNEAARDLERALALNPQDVDSLRALDQVRRAMARSR
jgi:regulator of sirC expression with transglutaminase-like and TPR domain